VATELRLLEEEAVGHGVQMAASQTKVQQHFQQLNETVNGDVEFARRAAGTLR